MRKETGVPQLPKSFLQFTGENPVVAKAYEALGQACAKAGPVDDRTRELVKLGMAIGARLEGAVHSHTRRALEAGATPEEVRHVVALAAPTLGFPVTVAAYTWVEEVLTGAKSKGK
jgi:AhpD family alkylhydroperoxidase